MRPSHSGQPGQPGQPAAPSSGSTTVVADSTAGSADSGDGSQCEGLVQYGCNMYAWVEYCPLGWEQGDDPDECQIDPSNNDFGCINPEDIEEPSTVGGIDLGVLPICGMAGLTSLQLPFEEGFDAMLDGLCVDACNAHFSPADFGADPTFVNSASDTLYPQLICRARPATYPIELDGFCNADDRPIEPDVDLGSCNNPECMQLLEDDGFCAHSGAEVESKRGSTLYSTLDPDWVEDAFSKPGVVQACHPGRYSFYDDEFGNLTVDSIAYQLGFNNGDHDLKVWEHDSSHAQVGSVYNLGSLAEAVSAAAVILPGVGDDVRLTFQVTTSANGTKTIHVDSIP